MNNIIGAERLDCLANCLESLLFNVTQLQADAQLGATSGGLAGIRVAFPEFAHVCIHTTRLSYCTRSDFLGCVCMYSIAASLTV